MEESLVEKYSKVLNNSDERLSRRFRALFSLKDLAKIHPEAIDEIGKSFSDSSELLKHELAYCLGQTKAEFKNILQSGRESKKNPKFL